LPLSSKERGPAIPSTSSPPRKKRLAKTFPRPRSGFGRSLPRTARDVVSDNVEFGKYQERLNQTLTRLADESQNTYEREKVHDWNKARLELLKKHNLVETAIKSKKSRPKSAEVTAPADDNDNDNNNNNNKNNNNNNNINNEAAPDDASGNRERPKSAHATLARPRSAIILRKYTTRPATAGRRRSPSPPPSPKRTAAASSGGRPISSLSQRQPGTAGRDHLTMARPTSAMPRLRHSENLIPETTTTTTTSSAGGGVFTSGDDDDDSPKPRRTSKLHQSRRHTTQHTRQFAHGRDETHQKVERQNRILTDIDDEREKRQNRANKLKMMGIKRKDRRQKCEAALAMHDESVKILNREENGKRELRDAADLLTDALELDPDSHYFHILRSTCWRGMNMHDRAWADLSQAIMKSEEPHPVWFASRASIYLHLHRLQEAKDDLDRACEYGHDNPHHFYNRAILVSEHFEKKDYELAHGDMNRAVKLMEAQFRSKTKKGDHTMTMTDAPINFKHLHSSPSHQDQLDLKFYFRLRLHRGDIRRKLGNATAAVADLAEAVSLDNHSATGWFLLGKAHLLSEDPIEAERCFTNAIEIDTDYAEYFFQRGNARLEIPNHIDSTDNESLVNYSDVQQRALDDFITAIALQKDMEEAMEDEHSDKADKEVLAARVRADTRLDDKAVIDLMRRRRAYYHSGLCRAYLAFDTPKFAALSLNEVTTALDIDYSNHIYLHLAGLSHLSMNTKENDAKAAEMFQKVLKVKPDYCPTLYYSAKAYLKEGDFIRASDALVKCISLDNKGLSAWDVYHLRGLIFFKEGLLAVACENFEKSIELEQGSKKLNKSLMEKNYFQRGETKRCSGNFKGALEDYAMVEKLAPQKTNRAPYLFARGLCLAEMGGLDAGLNDLTLAVELDATNTTYISRRADVLAKLGLYAQAEQALDRGVEISMKKKDKNLWVLLKKLANSSFTQDKFSQACNQFQTALLHSKSKTSKADLAELHYKRGICQARMKKYRAASESFSSALKAVDSLTLGGTSMGNYKKILFHHELAKANQMMHRHHEAIEDFSWVVKMNPEDDRAVFRRGWSYKALGLFLLAAEDFERAKELNPSEKLYELNYKHIGDIETVVMCPAGEERIPDHMKDVYGEGLAQPL
jgi:tetratricopeptide (TPR) repeat protein